MGFGLWYLESETGTHFNGHQRISTDLDRQALSTADTDHVPTLYTCGKGEEEVPAKTKASRVIDPKVAILLTVLLTTATFCDLNVALATRVAINAVLIKRSLPCWTCTKAQIEIWL